MDTDNSKANNNFFSNVNATRIIVTVIGVIFGFSGMNHGFFEFLQGNKPTPGLFINAIGEAHRFWLHGTEGAFSVIPDFMITGITAMVTGLAIIIWTIKYIETNHGRSVFLGLFIILLLAGGGIGQIIFFIPAWAFGTRIKSSLVWWRKVFPHRALPFLSGIWPFTLGLSTICILFALELAVFGILPGVTDPDTILNFTLSLVVASAFLNIMSFISGFAHEIRRKPL